MLIPTLLDDAREALLLQHPQRKSESPRRHVRRGGESGLARVGVPQVCVGVGEQRDEHPELGMRQVRAPQSRKPFELAHGLVRHCQPNRSKMPGLAPPRRLQGFGVL
ncbi:MAG: hypothetical protein WAW17_23910 [Rhodococcus sp. (in: high G+C Gram-positive bacteria)]